MNKAIAQRLLNWGYIFFVAGLCLGSLLATDDSAPKGTTLFTGYCLWSAYWGYLLISQPFDDFFRKNTPVHISAINAEDYIQKTMEFKCSMVIKKMCWGFFWGLLGGAIYKQVKLSKIAYFT